jgi:hypothetical protein
MEFALFVELKLQVVVELSTLTTITKPALQEECFAIDAI